MTAYWPTREEIDDMGERALQVLWRSLPLATNDEQRDTLERLAIRCEALGLVDARGQLR